MTALRLGTSASRSRRSYASYRDLLKLCMRAAGRARTLFTLLRGLSVLGVDAAETALVIARKKAASRGIDVEFTAANAFQLGRLGRTLETVLDCGLFHALEGDERIQYAASLASVTRRNATVSVVLQ
jgi:hypothetical protein